MKGIKDLLTRRALVPVRLLGQLPPRLARAVVRPACLLGRVALPSRRRIGERTIELCFRELMYRQRQQIVSGHFRFLAEMLADSGMAWCRPGTLDERFGSVSGLGHVQAVLYARQGGRTPTGPWSAPERGGGAGGE